MSRRVPKVQLFRCSVLKGIAALELDFYYDPHVPDPEENPERIEWQEIMVRMTDCRHRRQCGIMEKNSSGFWSIHWERCPAAQQYSDQES
jgi:hypothetical protein